MNQFIYCPYTDREIFKNKCNSEHIIPLSLGGINGFEIPVDDNFNSKIGSELDGALANNFLIKLRRSEYNARGHSKKKPIAIENATYGKDNRIAKVHLHKKEGVRLWDILDQKFKKDVGSFKISTTMNIDIPVRFAAKTALAAGYYAYGDLFREHIDHKQLRDVMTINLANLDLSKSPKELGLDHLTLTTDDYLLDEEPSEPNSWLFQARKYTSVVQGSIVMLVPGKDCFAAVVGILGQYLAMVQVPANTKSFPNSHNYKWGHVIAITNRKLIRCSCEHALKQWVNSFEIVKRGKYPRIS